MVDLAIAFARVGSPGEDPFDLEGDLLDSQIRVEKLIGEGEFSVVYRGLHESMNAPVAIKCLNLPQTLEPKLVEPISEAFSEGARVHYRLAQGHLHIAQTLALGTTLAPRTGQLIPYVVREWLEGRSLAADFAARALAKTRPRSPAQAVELLESAADAVAYAHDESVCHHALSPKNLFLVKTRGRVVLKVLDFGMARGPTSQPPVNAGLSLLSSHAAPEQLDRRVGASSAATDVFAFALILFEAVTGRPYFAPAIHVTEMLRIAETREPLSRRASGVAVPRELQSVLSRALAPTPRDRHSNLRAFWDDVKRSVQRVSSFHAPPARRSFPPGAPLAAPFAPPTPVVEVPSIPAAPQLQTAAPPLQTAAPPLQTLAPALQTLAPPVQTLAPPVQTLAPPVQTAAPPLQTAAPPPETAAPPLRTGRPPLQTAAPPPVIASFAAAPWGFTELADPHPSSVTCEVAPPVTTSTVLPAASRAVDDDAAFQRDTLPGSPHLAEDGRRTVAMLGGTFGAQWNALLLHTKSVVARPAVAASLVGALASLACVVVAIVAVVAWHAPRSPNVAAGGAHERRSPHHAMDEQASLVLSESPLRVAPVVRGFDREATRGALDETASELESCTHDKGPRGPGSVRVIIYPNGKIARLQIGPPYAGTATGHCIASRFVDTPLPPYVGPPQAMNYIFNTIPFGRR